MAVRRVSRRPAPGRLRVATLSIVLLLAWVGMGWRLFEVQVVRASELAALGEEQRLTRRELAPERGTIFDRNGDPLAMTVEAATLYADPVAVADPLYVAQRVAALTGRDYAALHQALLRGVESDQRFVYLARQVEPEVAEQVLALEMPGVYSVPEPKREYPGGSLASPVVGVASLDGEGLEGLELVYEEVLRGTPGRLEYERDRAGRPIPQGFRQVVAAVPGEDLVATVDLSLQYAAAGACATTVERTGAQGCWIVVLQPETGEVLALAGTPVFDPVTRTSPDGRFDNFAVRGMYEPGSTQKLITVAAALDTGAVGVGTVVPAVADRYEVTPGACASADDDIYGCFGDFARHETRDMTVQEIFTESSNVGTIKISERLAQGKMIEYMEAFGLGRATGIDFNGEAAGTIRVDAGCSSCLASTAIGYSVAVTPLQMAAAYAAVANDGEWVQPYLVGSRVDADGRVVPFVPERRRVVSQQTAWVLRQLLTRVVDEGTGRQARIPGYRVGGKTGTADKLGPDGVYTEETIASFVGMAPIDDPKVVVAVVVDDPAYEYRTGGLAAAPAFAEVMEAALHQLGVTPDGIEG